MVENNYFIKIFEESSLVIQLVWSIIVILFFSVISHNNISEIFKKRFKNKLPIKK